MRFLLILIVAAFLACNNDHQQDPVTSEQSVTAEKTDPHPATIGAIGTPDGFERIAAKPGSFAAWLRAVPLKKDKTVRLYNGQLKPNQSAQYAVVDMTVGNKDLQQCADVVMRLRADYLFAAKRFADIAFVDYANNWHRWTGTDNRAQFDRYLENVFGWCGSASLEKQLKPVVDFNTIETGDVLIKGGFPGHAVIVADMAVDKNGNKRFLLVQGYQPAQDAHVLVNPADHQLSPWYAIPDVEDVQTPEWWFKKENLRRW